MTGLARLVLGHWPAVFRGTLVPLGGAGGFSGARLWRLSTPAGDFCLKASPHAEGPHLARYDWMRMAATLPFVPALMPVNGRPFLELGRVWELQSWMPGRADYRDAPTEAKLRAACRALASLHEVWATRPGPITDEVPAVERRLEVLAEPTPDAHLARLAAEARRGLQAWRGPAVRLQPCLVDVWHDHVLFTGEEVTGVVDYSSMGLDATASDVARLLGSLVGDDEGGWRVGLSAYGRLSPSEERLARLLDRAGAAGAAIRWERWLREGRAFADPEAARRRGAEVLRRVRR
jgi:hypothetical protein